MKIVDGRTCRMSVPLKKPFKTALRTVYDAASLIVIVTYDQGDVSYGEAVPTAVITGETLESIDYAICEVIRPILLGASLSEHEQIFSQMDRVLACNTSAKAAVDMAIYDGLGKQAGLPLYQYLGGYRSQLETDYTVSVNRPLEMAEDARKGRAGYTDAARCESGLDWEGSGLSHSENGVTEYRTSRATSAKRRYRRPAPCDGGNRYTDYGRRKYF